MNNSNSKSYLLGICCAPVDPRSGNGCLGVSYRRPQMKSQTKVVVIGGGIAGCSTLYHLTQEGWTDVVLVELGPFDTNFFGNMIPGTDEDIAKAYGHVTEFFEGFGGQVQEMFKDDNAPTDPMIVVKIFEDLINAPAGARPMRTIAGIDFGFQALNDAVEPLRKASLESMGLADCDGPRQEAIAN